MRLLHQYNTQIKQISNKIYLLKPSDIYCIKKRAVVGIRSSAVIQTSISIQQFNAKPVCTGYYSSKTETVSLKK